MRETPLSFVRYTRYENQICAQEEQLLSLIFERVLLKALKTILKALWYLNFYMPYKPPLIVWISLKPELFFVLIKAGFKYMSI